MKQPLLAALSLLLLQPAAAQTAPTSKPVAKHTNAVPDIILTGGKIFTADPARPYAQALAVRGERIVAVGATADVARLAGPRTRRIDLHGRTVVPGFNDAHTHLPPGNPLGRYSRFPKAPTLAGPGSAEVLDTLTRLARRVPPGTWLEAEVGLTVLLDPQVRRAALDKVAPNNPVMLLTPWGHGCVANSLALQRLHIADGDPDPVGGAYERQPGTGQLTGSLLEYGSWGPRRDLNGQVPDAIWVRQFQAYGAEALRFGITSVQNMADALPPAQTVRVVRAAKLPLRHRIIPFFMTTSQGIKHQEWAGVDRRPAPLARIEGMKYILDATPLEGGALMRHPYPGRPGWYGKLNFPIDTVRSLLRRALASSDQLMLHVAGDSTASLVLRLMSQLADDATWRRKRVRFEHGDGVAPDLRPRAKALGVIVVQNPSHYIAEMNKQHGAAMQVPAGFRTLLESGVPFALGSDGPSNPLLNLLFAATLADPKEALSREQAVRAYTAGSAYAEFQEQNKGTLAPGKLADLAVLSQDIFTVPLPALPGTVSELTMVGGKVVYEANRGATPGPAALRAMKKPAKIPAKPKLK